MVASKGGLQVWLRQEADNKAFHFFVLEINLSCANEEQIFLEKRSEFLHEPCPCSIAGGNILRSRILIELKFIVHDEEFYLVPFFYMGEEDVLVVNLSVALIRLRRYLKNPLTAFSCFFVLFSYLLYLI